MGKQFFTTKEATRIIGCSTRQLQYWRDKNVIVPSISATGTGRSIYYNYSDLVDLAIMKHGLDMGLSFDTARKCLMELRDGQPDYIYPETNTWLMLYWGDSDSLELEKYNRDSAIALFEQGKLVIPLQLDQIHRYLINNLQTTESSSSSKQKGSEQTNDLTYHQTHASHLILGSILAGQKRLLVEMAIKDGTSNICSNFCLYLYQLKWSIEGIKKRTPRILFIVEHKDKTDFVINHFINVFQDKQLFKIQEKAKKKPVIYFASYYHLVEDPYSPNLYQAYDSDYFDLIIVEDYTRYREYTNQSQSILEYFEPAYQLAFISMDSQQNLNEVYEYFGYPIYQYTKEKAIEDGLIKP